MFEDFELISDWSFKKFILMFIFFNTAELFTDKSFKNEALTCDQIDV